MNHVCKVEVSETMKAMSFNGSERYGRLNRGLELLANNQFSKIWWLLCKQTYSTDTWFGMKRDLREELQKPRAKINISVRPLEDRDLGQLLNTDGLTAEEVKLVGWQHRLLSKSLQTCYVAVTDDGTPCYMQWLIGPAENKNILGAFRGLFPELKENEALLEGAYMHPSFRGLGIMPDAMCQISEKALGIGANEVITFVGIDNIASLKGCKSCGYHPYMLLKRRWLLFTKAVSSGPIPEDVMAGYETMTAKRPRLQQNKEPGS